ncbi:MAG: hypothetical protein QOJ44_1559 [Acidimicrobiaceae bacterium]|nr:hypothetical protein [Acidimicrobiaceae bacterium]
MGLFRRIKDGVDGSESPTGGPINDDVDFEPIGGVSLERYVELLNTLASTTGSVVTDEPPGFSAPAWQSVSEGWAARIRSNPAVAASFDALGARS